jgi:hypothetical protein
MLMGVAYFIGGRISQFRTAAPQAAPPTKTAAVAFTPLAGAMFQSGGWTFAGQGWDITSELVGTAEVDARLTALGKTPVANPATYPDVPREILQAIEVSHLQPVERPGGLLYTFQKPNLKAQLLACKVDGMLKAVTFGIAYPSNSEKWQFLQGRPNGKSSAESPNERHLLPMPANGKRIASRFADDGQILLEVVTLSSNADELIIKWREAGWDVRPSGLGNPSAFSLLCARGNDVVYAWSADPREALQSLMLVRSPTDAELQSADSAAKQ